MKKVLLLFFVSLFMFFWLFESPVMARGVVVNASWYGGSCFEGRLMANGESFKTRDRTIAAHRKLPMGTQLIVKNPDNGRTLRVVVKDRGPFVKGRNLDLSWAAAKELGYVKEGVTKLIVVALK